MASSVKPNDTHVLIDKLARTLSTKGVKVVLMTQNIDDLHLRPKNNEYIIASMGMLTISDVRKIIYISIRTTGNKFLKKRKL